jgi:ACS family tartrate transporter-like MFS transporter
MPPTAERELHVPSGKDHARLRVEPDGGSDGLEAVTMRRVGWRLLPLLFLLYIVCFIDRTNVAFAALQMNRDLGFSAAVYGLGSGIFFLGYALFEVPSNLILARVGARRWIGRIAISWGAITVAMMFVRSAESFYVMRFLLGVAEAGYFPGVIYYLGQWFPQRMRARAVSRIVIGIPLSSAVGGALGGALLGLDGTFGLAGWQWLFLVEGLPAVVLGAIAIFYLTDRPGDAHWLTASQRAWLLAHMETERRQGAVGHGTLREVFTSKAVWWLCVPYFAFGISSYALSLWIPMMVRESARLDNQGVGVVVSLIGLVAAAGMMTNGAHSDRSGERVWHAVVPLLLATVGFALGVVFRLPMVTVAGLGLAFIGLTAFLPAFWCLPTAILGGSAAAAAIAFINSIGNLGGFVGPSVLGAMREQSGSFRGGLLLLTAISLFAAVFTLRLRREHTSP